MRWKSMLVLVGLCLSGCLPPGFDPHPPPTIGPGYGRSAGGAEAHMFIQVSATCVDPGQDLDIQVVFKNKMPYPIKIISQPVVEITIESRGDMKTTTLRWSQSSSYPTDFNPVLSPQEERVYHWVWKVDPAYDRARLTASAQSRVDAGKDASDILMESRIDFDVGYVWNVDREWECDQLERAR